ncbi:hypothetical protein CWI38_2142p0010 [Hamiltosporidium tvaerminnensis]|uniref:Coatomer subunit zeta n=2 Tax=Hamiltosporidium TaxID=1176354 RepID=A0A4Q9L318_9MICR|nr:Golgi-to-ER vesicle coat component [Hamiltosporidium tvaerminnensis]TBU00900.1 hypothetical protein CWI36_1498p0020 [Hamiltosporidium magnivora]TBU09518.1 hypothetical protein CWI38_2142p0010 [Hamiltosporidium tvaerminnensis]
MKLSVYDVQSITVLDEDGNIIIERNYSRTQCDVNTIYKKIISEKSDITIIEDMLVIYKIVNNIIIFICLDSEKNDIFAEKLLDVFYNSLNYIISGSVNKESIVSKYDLVLVLLNNFIDEGMVIETETDVLTSKIESRSFEELEGMQITGNVLSFLDSATKSLSSLKK